MWVYRNIRPRNFRKKWKFWHSVMLLSRDESNYLLIWNINLPACAWMLSILCRERLWNVYCIVRSYLLSKHIFVTFRLITSAKLQFLVIFLWGNLFLFFFCSSGLSDSYWALRHLFTLEWLLYTKFEPISFYCTGRIPQRPKLSLMWLVSSLNLSRTG